MVDLKAMTEEELRDLQARTNARVNELRREGKGTEAYKLRQEVLRIAEVADAKQRERYAEYEKLATEVDNAQTVEIAAEAAAAVSTAEKIIGGKE